MNPDDRQDLVKTRGLAGQALADARGLAAVCNQYEGLDLPLNLDAAGYQFLHYADGRLVGILTLQVNGEIEVCLAVDPGHRRRGVGRGLLAAAGEACRQQGASSVLLVCEEASRSGMAFVEAVGARYRSSEYRMKLDVDASPGTPPSQSTIRLRQADAGDVQVVAQIIAIAFGRSEDIERRRVGRDIQKPTHRFYIAHLNDEPVGGLGVVAHGDRVWIVAFGVLPEFRGRGYGRQMLAATAGMLRAEHWKEILIEVATDNRNALSLYQSCGFRETTCYGYYQMNV